MAWRCVRCEKNIFAPRDDAFSFAMRWTFSRKYKDVNVDIVNLHDMPDNAVVTHLTCKSPETDGFPSRIRKSLQMPKDAIHPMLPSLA